MSYANNKKVGTAKVIIKGKGSYTGSKSVTFKIVKATNPLTVKVSAKVVKLANVKKKAQNVWPLAVKKAQGAKLFKVAKWITKKAKRFFKVDAKTGKVTVTKGTPKGSYQFKVKVSAKGNSNYKSGSKTVAVKVAVK